MVIAVLEIVKQVYFFGSGKGRVGDCWWLLQSLLCCCWWEDEQPESAIQIVTSVRSRGRTHGPCATSLFSNNARQLCEYYTLSITKSLSVAL
jgi:hypothetical protein